MLLGPQLDFFVEREVKHLREASKPYSV